MSQMEKDKVLGARDKKYANKFVTQDVFIETLYKFLTNQKNARLCAAQLRSSC